MKILILINSLRYGGANKVLVDLANYLAKKQHEVTIVTYLKDVNFYQIEEEITIKNIYTKFDDVKIVRRIAQALKLRKIVRTEKTDVIIAFNNIAKLLGLAATFLLRTKLIISERLDPYNYKPGKKNHMHFRYLLADGCVFQTQGAANYFPKKVRNKSTIIPNSIEINEELKKPVKNRKNQIAFVGRFEVRQKRQDIMLLSFKKISEIYQDINLVFYGDGPDKNKIEKMAFDLKIEDRVIFAGVVQNVLEVIRDSKLFVMTSDYEGIPNALLEAMALGIPCISTDCSPGGARSLIKNHKNGILVPVNDPDALSKAIAFMLDNPQKAEEYGREAQKVLDLYNPQKILLDWENYIWKVYKEDV